MTGFFVRTVRSGAEPSASGMAGSGKATSSRANCAPGRSDAKASCEGKKKLASYAEAKAASELVRGNRDKKGRTPYHCKHCGGWHVGTGLSSDQHGKRLKMNALRRIEECDE